MAFSISGTVYTDQGVTTMGAGLTVKVKLSTGGTGTATTASNGTFTISGLSGTLPIASVYLQGNTEVGLTIVAATGTSTNITGLVIYQDTLVFQRPTGATFTPSNTQINTALANTDSGVTSIASSSSTTSLATASGKHLHTVGTFTLSLSFTSITINGDCYFEGVGYSGSSSGTLTLAGTGSRTFQPGTGGMSASLVISSGTYTLAANMHGPTSGDVTINSGATLDVSASNYDVWADSWTNSSGTFVPRAGTIHFGSKTGQTFNDTTTLYNVMVDASSANLVLASAMNVSNNLTINASTTLNVSASNYAITVGGNWSNGGTFTAQNGTVTLNGTAKTISGSTTFYNLTKTVASADTLTFTDGTTQTISNALTLQGASGQLLTLQGTSTGGWTMAVPATQTLAYLSVSYSTATGNTAAASNSTNGGNNTNWTFGAVSYTLVASPGSFALTGIAAGLQATRKVTTSAGAFSFTGKSITLLNTRKLAVSPGSFSFSGTNAALKTTRYISAASGTFLLTGENAGFYYGHKLVAQSGTFSFTGEPTSLKYGHILVAATGVFLFTGVDTPLTRTRLLGANVGAFLFTGDVAGLYKDSILIASPTNFPLTGLPVTLNYGYTLVTSPGSFAFTGLPTTFSRTVTITGVTRDYATSLALGGCTVTLFKTSDNSVLGATTSDGGGNYSIIIPQVEFFVNAYKTGSPDKAGTTRNNLIGVT